MSSGDDDPKKPKKGLPAESEDDWLQAIDEWGSTLGEILEEPAAAPPPEGATLADGPKPQVFYKPDPVLDGVADPDRTRVAQMTAEQRAMLRSPTFPQELIPTKVGLPTAIRDALAADYPEAPTVKTTIVPPPEAEPTGKLRAPVRPTTSPRAAPPAPTRPAPAAPARPTTSPGRPATGAATPAAPEARPAGGTPHPAGPPKAGPTAPRPPAAGTPRPAPPPPRAAPPRPSTSPTMPVRPGAAPPGRPRFPAEPPVTIPGTGPLPGARPAAGARAPTQDPARVEEPAPEPTLAPRAAGYGDGAVVPHDTLESRADAAHPPGWEESTDEGDDFPAVEFGAEATQADLQGMLDEEDDIPSSDAWATEVPTAPSAATELEEIIVEGEAGLASGGAVAGAPRHEHSYDAPPERPHEYWSGRTHLLEGQLPYAVDDLAAARILLETARIYELKLASPQRAVSLYAQARAKAPAWLAPLQGLVRIAEDAGRWDEVDGLLEEALGLELSHDERIELSLMRAEIALSVRRDEERAAEILAETARLAPADAETSLALAELAFARHDPEAIWKHLWPLTEAGGRAAGGRAMLEGALRERAGDPVVARARYQEAALADASAVGVHAALERTAMAGDDRATAAAARLRLAEALGDCPEGAAVRYRAARLAHLLDARPAEAAQALSALPPTRARLTATLSAADAAGDVELARAAATTLAADATGSDRAPPLLALGLLLRRVGRAEEAEEFVARAATEGPDLGPAVWAEEELLRAGGHVQRAAERYAIFGEDAEAAAIFEQAGMSADAITLLERLPDDPAARGLSEALEVDRGQWPRVCLRRAEQIARGGSAASMAARLLSLAASQAGRLSDPSGAAETLARVRELTPDDPVTDSLPVLVIGEADLARATAARLEATRVEDDDRAASALVREGWARESAGDTDGALRAHEEALARSPAHPFAAAALCRLRWWRGDAAGAAVLHHAKAEHAGPRGAAEHVLAARATWDTDSAGAVAELQAALAAQGTAAEEALRRLAAWIAPPGVARADILEAMAVAGPGADAAATVAALVQAAEAREDADDAQRATDLWRRATVMAPGDPSLGTALERALERSGELAELAARCKSDIASEDPWRRALGYERLADLEGRVRRDEDAATAARSALAELRPDDLPVLRTLLRRQLAQRREDEATATYARIARALEGHVDAAPYCRRAAHLADRAKDAAPFGSLELAVIAAETEHDVWALRYLEANARLDRDAQALAAVASRLADAVGTPPERAAYRAREGEARVEAGETEAALVAFQAAAAEAPGHVVALRGAADTALSLGKHEIAAGALDAAARASTVPAHVADLAYRAGVVWQDTLHDDKRALDSFAKVLDADATYQDAFTRVMKILDAAGRPGDAALACEKRIAAGGPPELLSSLWRTIADRRLQLGDRAAAKDAMRDALKVLPADPEALRRLAELLLADSEWTEAIAHLVGLGQLVTDAEEVRRLFFQLGELFEDKAQEPKRAEESYRRVLTVDQHHLPTLERLSRLLVRQADWTAAKEVTAQLLQLVPSPTERRPWRVAMSQILEEGFKDLRGAEGQLEEARREAPTDLEAVGLLADFYRRHNAGPALSIHLDRAATDVRRVLSTQPFDETSYRTLARILAWRGKAEGARAASEILVLLGHPTAAELAAVAGSGAMQPGGADPALDEILVPPALPPALQELLRLVHETLEKAVGAEPKTFGVGRSDRLPSKGHPTRDAALAVARAYGFNDVDLYVSQRDAGALVALPGSPPSVIIGRDLFGATDEAERVFLIARALELVRAHLAVPLILPPSDLGLWLGAVVKQFDPTYAGTNLDPGALEERAQRLAKILPRKVREPLMPFALECEGAKALDPEAIAAGASELADRSALLVCGSIAAAIGALRKVSGDYLRLSSPAELVTRAGAVPAVRRLLAFAVSETCFEARTRAAQAGR